MDIDALKAALPKIATDLVALMVDDALRMYQQTGIPLTAMTPAVSLVYRLADGKEIKVTLSIDLES